MSGESLAERAKPFLKWVGGKRQLLSELRKRMPPTFGHYYEPFVGGGALYFDVKPQRATIGDKNARLVRTYLGVREDVSGVIDRLSSTLYENTPESFADARALNVDALPLDAQVAAWFIYVNKTAFNGLYRVNKKGVFNVPFGRYKAPTICDAENLLACAALLQGTTITATDFEVTVSSAKAGDFVYFDPPYVPVSTTSSFTSYTPGGFDILKQIQLRDVALDLKRKGVHVLLSNADTPVVRELYRDFQVDLVSARRNVNSKGDGRGAVGEILAS